MKDRLSHRERVVRALNHEEVDRIPIDFGGNVSSIMENSYKNLKRFIGICDDQGSIISGWNTVLEFDERVLKYFDIDFRRVGLGEPDDCILITAPDGSWVDEWGITYKKVGPYAEMIKHPLSSKNLTIRDLEEYKWPDPFAPGRAKGLKQKAQRLYRETDYAIVESSVVDGLFEISSWLRGFEQFMMDLVVNKSFAKKLVEKVAEFHLGALEVSLTEVGDFIQMIELGDDFGTQEGLFFSPETYREIFKPSHKKIINLVRSKTNAKIFHHSCGSIFNMIPELIDTGIDVLNPVQTRAKNMDPYKLKAAFGGNLSFHGGVDIQEVLPHGSILDVDREVKNLVNALAPGGGYILAPSHNVQDDVPPENIVAMYYAAIKYGRY